MRCGACGGFYNPKCPHWPQCYPHEDKPKLIDYGFQAYISFILSAIFTVLVCIWVKL